LFRLVGDVAKEEAAEIPIHQDQILKVDPQMKIIGWI